MKTAARGDKPTQTTIVQMEKKFEAFQTNIEKLIRIMLTEAKTQGPYSVEYSQFGKESRNSNVVISKIIADLKS